MSALRPSWGSPAVGPPEAVVDGDDADLAAAIERAGGRVPRLALTTASASELGRSVGAAAGRRATDVPLDAAVLTATSSAAPLLVVNAVVYGTAPERTRSWTRTRALRVVVDGRELALDRATGVVVAIGSFVGGLHLNPRSHPGDGRVEVQAFAVRRRERAELRRRARHGDHLGHPRVAARSGRRIEIDLARGTWPVVVDGHRRGRAPRVRVEVLTPAYVLVV